MTELSWQDKQRAATIYSNTMWFFIVVLSFLWFAVSIVAGMVARKYFGIQSVTGYFGGAYMLCFAVAQKLAVSRVEKAGPSLARTETHWLPCQNIAPASPTQYEIPTTRGIYIFGFIFLAIVLSVAAGFRLSGNPLSSLIYEIPFYLVGGFFLFWIVLLLRFRVLLRFDSSGIFCLHKGVFPRTLIWESLAGVEVQSIFNYEGREIFRRLELKNDEGKMKTIVYLSEWPLPERDQILADLRARLGADENGEKL